MESLTNAVGAVAGASEGFYTLVKKIPLLGDVIRYEERKEQTEKVVHEKFLNEYRILNDPAYQVNFINQFQNENERKLIMGHIIDVQSDAQKSLNIVSVLSQFCENTKETKSEEVDDKDIDPDWWLLWLERAKMTSNPLKQQILAKVLEFETKTHGSVSARFIRTLGDLSIEDLQLFFENAKFFSKHGSLFSGIGQFAPKEILLKMPFNLQKALENTGLARFAFGLGEYHNCAKNEIDGRLCFQIPFNGYTILVWKNMEHLDVAYQMSLTSEGLQLRNLLNIEPDMDYLKMLCEEISKAQTCRVSVHKNEGEKFIQKNELFAAENP